ncbi:hypothetical protein PQR66_34770 [Paraburkholderia agricolaris]|uniref:Uncharacterized protein n=1 Tax=Paraburkholderia agricolaris TaxID=2152888 RepID=A0ABW8ZY97_9BURK
MPTFKVYGPNPTDGPSKLSAEATRDNFNEDDATWGVVLAYNSSDTAATFTSATAPAASLRSALETAYPSPGFTVVEV